jgi:hypothetical protein
LHWSQPEIIQNHPKCSIFQSEIQRRTNVLTFARKRWERRRTHLLAFVWKTDTSWHQVWPWLPGHVAATTTSLTVTCHPKMLSWVFSQRIDCPSVKGCQVFTLLQWPSPISPDCLKYQQNHTMEGYRDTPFLTQKSVVDVVGDISQ